ncbi:unnamed protein product [Lactuca saligna]|uniref:Uncharacterized protein n=1 Tax=Lactuca saligna TaxID=75948 RepID=A0AA36DZ98_LACSI|nr:unnamed protein product [Lactuca saligna]
MNGEDKDGIDGEEDESVNSDCFAVGLHAPKLHLLTVSGAAIGACGEALERQIRMEGEGARGGMGPKLALTCIKDVCAHKDEANVHQFKNIMFETKEIVQLYLEVFEGWFEQTEAVDKIVSYNVGNIVYNVDNIASDTVEECSREETVAVNTLEEENLYEFGRLDNKIVTPRNQRRKRPGAEVTSC